MWKIVKCFFGFEEETPIHTEQDDISSSTPLSTPSHSPRRFKGALVKGNKSSFPSEIKVEEPRIYEDSLTIAMTLRENKLVIVNLTHLDSTTSKRLIDFVCGTAYAINGHMLKIGENIFLFTPESVVIVDSENGSKFTSDISQEDPNLYIQNAL